MKPHSQRLIAASKSKANPVPKAEAKAKGKPKAKSSMKKGKGKGGKTTTGKKQDGKDKGVKSTGKNGKQDGGVGEASSYSAARQKFLENPETLGLLSHNLFI